MLYEVITRIRDARSSLEKLNLNGMPYDPDHYWIMVKDDQGQILYQSKLTEYANLLIPNEKPRYLIRITSYNVCYTKLLRQSYPVFFILPVLFVLTGIVFYLIRPSILRTLCVKDSFKKRAVIATALLMLPLLSFAMLDQSQRRVSDNNYVNELASNGPYQLFAAFRNNRLDYRQFYATGNDHDLSPRLKNLVTGIV